MLSTWVGWSREDLYSLVWMPEAPAVTEIIGNDPAFRYGNS
jgi:hypothetical protein